MLLALDTSTRSVGIGLYDGVQVLSEVMWISKDFHTVELAPRVAEMFSKSDVKISDLKVIAVAKGPGSFTGLRIGLALAKGISLAQHLALIGIPTLDILAAAQQPRSVPMVAVIRAGRGRLAVGWYRVNEDKLSEEYIASGQSVWQFTGEMRVMTAEELSQQILEPTLICGELSVEERDLFSRNQEKAILASPAQSVRRPGILAELGWRRWQLGEVDDPATLSPNYLHHKEPIPG